MNLHYYYLIFEDGSEDCPGELWESILSTMQVVFASYGYRRIYREDHELHVLCEDDADGSILRSIPLKYSEKITLKKNITKKLGKFMEHFVPLLLNDMDLCVVDNTKKFLGADVAIQYEPMMLL